MKINEKIYFEENKNLTILRMTESSYLIEDLRNATGYVIVGKDRALVIDTCFGYENYAEVVASITNLPVVVVNTHAHMDHCGGNRFFEKAYIGEKEIPKYNSARQTSLQYDPPLCIAEIMHEGDIIDLGDRKIEAIHFAGHTPGALCLLDRKERILYTGDSVLGRTVYLFMDNSVSVSEMKESLLHLNEFRSDFDNLATGHGCELDPTDYIDELLRACDAILKGEPSDDFGIMNAHGQDLPCYYYKGEHGIRAPLIYREDLAH